MPEHTGRAVLAVAAAAVMLAACAKDTTAGAAGPALPPKSSTPAAASTAPSGPATNERGLIPKTLGQEAGLTNEKGEPTATFAIDTVTVDPPCHEYGSKPDSGHTLLLAVRVATNGDAEAAGYMALLINPYSFAEVGADGVTRSAQLGNCTDYTKNLPGQFGVNQKYAGTIELVVPEASGVLTLQDQMGGSNGWEWTY